MLNLAIIVIINYNNLSCQAWTFNVRGGYKTSARIYAKVYKRSVAIVQPSLWF